MMRLLARWHLWLGWLVGVPLLLWTASGLFMTSWPIEQVRGEGLRARPGAVVLSGLTLPQSGPVRKLALLDEAGRPVWLVTTPGGKQRRYDARGGQPLAAVDEREARAIAAATYRGGAALAGITRFAAEAAPLELRAARPSWQIRYADDTHLYVDAETGEVLALRTPLWRVFDFMWGLHIMDLQTRENTHHPLLIGSAALAFGTILLGVILLFRRRGKRKFPAPGRLP